MYIYIYLQWYICIYDYVRHILYVYHGLPTVMLHQPKSSPHSSLSRTQRALPVFNWGALSGATFAGTKCGLWKISESRCFQRGIP